MRTNIICLSAYIMLKQSWTAYNHVIKCCWESIYKFTLWQIVMELKNKIHTNQVWKLKSVHFVNLQTKTQVNQDVI